MPSTPASRGESPRARRAAATLGRLLLALPLAALTWLPAPMANAAPGDLDPAFGNGGRVITGYDGPLDDTPYWEIDGFYGRAFAVAIGMYALLSPDAEWQIAQRALDCLATELADTRPIGGTALSPPVEFKEKVLLRLQVGVPTRGVDEFLPRLQLALEATVREVVGPDVSATFGVEPAGESGTDT